MAIRYDEIELSTTVHAANPRLTTNSSTVRIYTEYGYIDLGPGNTSWCHFSTDRTAFYFNKGIHVETGVVSSYDEDLDLRRAGTSKITAGVNNIYIKEGIRIQESWGQGDYSAEQLSIVGSYASMSFRDSQHDHKWLIHHNSSDALQFYEGDTWNNNTWSPRASFLKGSSGFAAHRFVDIENGSYFVEPASTSNLNSLTLAGSLSVSGNIESTSQVSVANRTAISVAHWSLSGTSYGAIKIKIPGTHSGNWSMLVLRITTYEYNSNNATIYYASGHDWTSGWYNYGVTKIGDSDKNVSFGYDSSNDYVIVGTTSSSWSYGHVTVDVMAHPGFYNSNMDITTGWTITQDSSLSGITIQNATNRKVLTTSDEGSGNGIDADTVDGIQGASLLRSDTSDSFTGNYLGFPTLSLGIANNNSDNGFNTYFRGNNTHFVLGLSNGNTLYMNYGNSSGTMRTYGTMNHEGNTWMNTSRHIYSPIYYDDNTSYYVNADATSNLYNLELSGAKHTYLYINPGNGYEAMVRFNGGSGSTWYVGSRTSTQLIGSTDAYHVYSQTTGQTVGGYDSSGHHYAVGSSRSPIFYDLNNTSYFLNPDTTGVSLKIKGGIVSDAPSGSILLEHQVSEANAWIFKENAANWGLYWFNAGSETDYTFGSYTTVGAELLGFRQSSTTNSINPNAWSGIDVNAHATWMLSNYSGDFWSAGTQYSATDMRSPIFYDSNNTGYYCDPTGTSYLSGLTVVNQISGSISGASNAVANTGYGSSNYTWKQDSGSFAGFNGWHSYLISNHGNGSNYYNQTIAMPFWGPPRYSRLENNTFRGPYDFWTSERDIQSSLAINAPVFYDYNDTNWWMDPAASSSAKFRQFVQIGDSSSYNTNSGSWGARLNVTDNVHAKIDVAQDADGMHSHWYAHTGHSYIHFGTTSAHGVAFVSNNSVRGQITSGGTLEWWNNVSAPIYYDYNNTSYYLDPASTSNLNVVQAKSIRNDGSVASDDGFGIYWENTASTGYAIYREAGSWSNPFPDLRIAFHTGIKLGGHKNYNGIRFYNNSDMATITASIGDGDDNMRSYYDIIAYASDKRLKTNVEPITNAIDKVKSLQGMTYNWNEVGKEYGWEPSEEREVGVFAQDVQAVLPEAVKLAPFDQDHDTEGNMYSKSGENFLTVKYEKIVPLLIEAIKEQQKQIDELKTLINKS